MTVDPRTPCLIGWAQSSRFDGEPLAAWADVLQATGVAPASIDSLDVVYCQSWPYDDPPGRLAAAVGAAPRRTGSSGMSGTSPHVLLADAAARIAAGTTDVAAVVGAEALHQVRRLERAGERPAWSFRAEGKRPLPLDAPFHPAELAHEVFQAYTTFALWEVARRARRGLGVEEHRRSMGELFAPMTKVAAANPHAWFPQQRTPDELWRVTPDNRMVSFPYTKRLVAIMDVDLAAAVVLASHEAADRLGVPADRRVYLRGAAFGCDPVYVAEHDEPWRSPAMAAVFEATLQRAGVTLDDVAHLDLYSCFPSSVALALDALGIGSDDARAPFTVTGGLPYAGGAGSCYCLSQLAMLADVLCADPGSVGMATAVGMHLTKHAAQVWSTDPGTGFAPGDDLPGPAVVRPIVDVYEGAATVATYTVHHGRDGEATHGLAVVDLPGGTGARAYARVRDPEVLAALEAEEWVGRSVRLVDGGNGVNELRP